jgi:putative DNA primase/helicase
MTLLLQAALDYAKRGLKVFPCAQKIPLTGSGGFKNATADLRQIQNWWGANPNAQIGLATGSGNHLFVVDVDGPAGTAALAALKLPETFTVQTRPGRIQLWFRQPDGVTTKCSAGVLGEQLDVRGDGGYVVAPPSIHHITGQPYLVLKNVPWAKVPACLLEVRNGTQPSVPNEIPKGRRNSTLLSIAGALRARGLSRAMILGQLQITNLRQCVPHLEDSELEKIADYVGGKPPGFRGVAIQETTTEIDIECFSDIEPELLRWLWPGKIPLGKLTIFVGDPGQGKSLATLDIAARVSRGDAFPDGAPSATGDTLLLTCEDDPADTIAPRLGAARARLSRIHRVRAVKVALPDGSAGESTFNFERDLGKLDEALGRIPETRLLIVDPVSAYMGRIDTHRDAEIRRVLAPLAELASRRRIAVIGVMHLKKSEASALLRVSGSVGFVAAARVVWGFGEDPEAPENRVMVPVKNNLAPLGSGLAYRIKIEPGEQAPHVAWQKDAVQLDANEVLASDPRAKLQRGGRRTGADKWLLLLLGNGQQKAVAEIMAEAERAGIGWRTVEAVKKECGVVAFKQGDKWFWALRECRNSTS